MDNHLPVPAPAGDAAPAHLRDLFDPCDLCPIERVPLIPEAARRQRHVFVPADHRFKAAARFLQSLGNPFSAIGRDETGRVGIDWGVYGVPETFIVGADGTVRHKHVGPLTPESMPAFHAALAAAAR